MGKRSRQFEEEERSVRCKVCNEDITIEFYLDRGDIVSCEECECEYIIKSRNPTILFLLDEDFDEYDDESFDDDYLGKGYD